LRYAIRTNVLAILFLASALSLVPEDATRIYVYAQRDTAARSWIAISCGSAVVAELKQGTFFAINVAPGAYTLLVDKGVPLSIEAPPGEESFVRLDWNYGIDRPPIPTLVKVPQSEARKEMKFLSYIGIKRVHSSLVPKTDPSSPVQPQLRRRGSNDFSN
jgi:hypothetical protein